MALTIPQGWQAILADEVEKPYFQALEVFLTQERQRYTVYPKESEVFSALEYTPYPAVRVLILGQDPYHGPHQAHGCSFSVRPGVPPPPSLQNIFKELQEDVGATPPDHGCLVPWARQGVLLLNAVLTVRAGQANSHAGHGWETFTDAVIRAVNRLPDRVVFLLWGAYARKKAGLVDPARHTTLENPPIPRRFRPPAVSSAAARSRRPMPPCAPPAGPRSTGSCPTCQNNPSPPTPAEAVAPHAAVVGVTGELRSPEKMFRKGFCRTSCDKIHAISLFDGARRAP